jgi:hypothetical protein
MVEKSNAPSSHIRGSWNFLSWDDLRNGRQADLSGYPGSWALSREYEFSSAELARQLGVCISAIAKALRKMEGED